MEGGDGYFGHLTQEQEKTMIKFKEEVTRVNTSEWKYDLSQFDDYDYLRFLRARQYNIGKTMEMFTKYIKWRIDFKVDTINVSFRSA